jgi:hypothetical protein
MQQECAGTLNSSEKKKKIRQKTKEIPHPKRAIKPTPPLKPKIKPTPPLKPKIKPTPPPEPKPRRKPQGTMKPASILRLRTYYEIKKKIPEEPGEG